MAELAAVSTTFIWVGMLLGVSFIETPLKFRAPGITIALGLGIGRLVFRAMNIVEAVLATALGVSLVVLGVKPLLLAIFISITTMFCIQAGLLRPQLDRRAKEIIAGGSVGRSRKHHLYVGFELAKLILLFVLGTLLVGAIKLSV